MSDNSLLQKINLDTEVSVRTVQEECSATLAAIQRETDTALSQMRTQSALEIEKEKAHLHMVSMSQAKQKAHISLQRARREEVNAIFAEATRRVVELSDEDYVDFFFEKVHTVLPKGARVERVDAPVGRGKATQTLLKKCHLDGDVTEVATLTAGLIVTCDDGVYDITLARILGDRQVDIEMLIARQIK